VITMRGLWSAAALLPLLGRNPGKGST